MNLKDKTYYWIKLFNAKDWEIGVYHKDEDFWFISGDENMIFPKDIEQIGEEVTR